MSRRIEKNSNKDGVDRRGFLECMAWAGTGMVWTVSGGVLSSKAFGQGPVTQMGGSAGFSFVQISDSHIGFNKAANSDVTSTFQQAISKINALERNAGLSDSYRRLEPSVKTDRIRHARSSVKVGQIRASLLSFLANTTCSPTTVSNIWQRYGKGTKGGRLVQLRSQRGTFHRPSKCSRI